MELFVFGPLAEAATFEAVTGRPPGGRPAWLPGHAMVGAPDAEPALVAQEGAAVEGLLVPPLTGAEAARLAAYGAALGHRGRAARVIPEGDAPRMARLQSPEAAPGAPAWDRSAWRAGQGARWAFMAGEIADHAPPLSPQSFARQSAMIAARASARCRAARAPAPATLRHDAAPQDAAWRLDAPLSGEFFKLATMRVSHRRFDGGRNEALPREVLVGVDAALVLPYDPARDRVLMVEQFRSGPMRRGAANPWSLEPVAGIVDAGETPQEAGLREAREEAGLDLGTLIPIFDGYPSPGASSDHFHCFLAIADLPQEESWRGGLPEEHEDLRLHAVPFERAMALAQSGEIDVIPMLAMLYWLAGQRARLRAEARGTVP
ncbi:ADP-ribose pyrophosphatase [Limimaricola hongkongensis DSM 17492]|uniref:ADP-ribose pyrophosphatase n=1 Tax=Limimaricola hongkongensis DSM 17492 TaxID=1122180 RepID=A0A017HED3_9RHOB|nr:ADP-ribose pyrophosphatase [Limimaricola hongkongensis DSM 17492]